MIPVIVTMVENFVLYSRSLTSCSAAFQGTILDRSLKQKHLQGTDKSRCRQRSKTSLTEEKSQPGLGNKTRLRHHCPDQQFNKGRNGTKWWSPGRKCDTFKQGPGDNSVSLLSQPAFLTKIVAKGRKVL
jgi:hypothetical protein